MGANDKTSVGSGSGEWQTPLELFDRLNRTFRFDYDAFASHDNALCSLYSTVAGTFIDGIPELAVDDRDGLVSSWANLSVFMNPPYGRGFIAKATAKAAAERNNARLIVALLPANTDTRWWHENVMQHAALIQLLEGRIHFIDPSTGQPAGSPPGGSALAFYFPDWR